MRQQHVLSDALVVVQRLQCPLRGSVGSVLQKRFCPRVDPSGGTKVNIFSPADSQ